MVSIRKWPVHEILELGHDDKVIIWELRYVETTLDSYLFE